MLRRGEQGGQAGPPLHGAGQRGGRVEGQDRLQGLGEAPGECVPLSRERHAGGGGVGG